VRTGLQSAFRRAPCARAPAAAASALAAVGAVAAACGLAACASTESPGAPSGPDASVRGAGDSGTTSAGDSAPQGADATTSGAAPDSGADAQPAPCPAGMALVGTFCIDLWEDHVVEVDDAGVEHAHSPYDVVDGLTVRAKTAPGVVPQGYISQVQATAACASAGKRLCSPTEFQTACDGADAGNWYPYGGETRMPGYCNEGKGSMMPLLFGSDPSTWTYADFNDPRLDQIDGGLAPTASYPRCQSRFGIFDCVGNLHEWGDDPPDTSGHGRFRGGFYGDAELNGHGCLYVTSAHAVSYHDYSTGFRCCADARSNAGD
jgi:sulfatase modifying factor 1